MVYLIPVLELEPASRAPSPRCCWLIVSLLWVCSRLVTHLLGDGNLGYLEIFMSSASTNIAVQVFWEPMFSSSLGCIIRSFTFSSDIAPFYIPSKDEWWSFQCTSSSPALSTFRIKHIPWGVGSSPYWEWFPLPKRSWLLVLACACWLCLV